MSMPTRFSLVVLLAVITAGCAPYKNTRVLEADKRVVVYSERASSDTPNARKIQVMCSEPSPDALKTLAGSLSVEKQNVAALAAAYSEAGANIGLRTQSIQLLRDQLFAICQGYANEGISGPAYQMMLTRNQRNTVALMAIEQLTGVLRTPAVTLSGSATIGPNKDIIDQNTKLKNDAEAAFKKLSEDEQKQEKGKALQKQIADYTANIEKAEKAIVSAATTAESRSSTGTGADAATVKEVATAVKEIAKEILSKDDLFYVCLDADQTYTKNNRELPTYLRTRCDAVYSDPNKTPSFTTSEKPDI